jgi:DNA-binding winged helix-turn-helix (wHTH) protein
MIYETKNHWLINNGKKIKLTNKEHKMLVALAGEILVTYEELAERIYYCEYQYVAGAIRNIKRNLMKKTNINIETLRGRGFILETKILFE